jgi:protein gp37
MHESGFPDPHQEASAHSGATTQGLGKRMAEYLARTTCGVRKSYSRVDVLRQIPAQIRFISAEPLLESLADIELQGYQWFIAGGESGSGYRPMQETWAREPR